MEGEAEDGDVKDEDVAGRADSLSGSCQKTARVAQRKVPWHKACLADTGCYRHPAATGARAMRMVESPVGDGRPGFQPQFCSQLAVHRPGSPALSLPPPLRTGGLEAFCAKYYTVLNPETRPALGRFAASAQPLTT